MKNCLLGGRIGELRLQIVNKPDAVWLAELFEQRFGSYPSPHEVDSWKHSLPIALTALDQGGLAQGWCLVEYALPFDYGRCDLILFGTSHGKLNLVVIELKQWTRVTPYSEDSEIVEVEGLGLVSHPSYQVLNYAGKIRHFHSVGEKSNVYSCAFLHNLDSKDDRSKYLSGERFSSLVREAPIFFSDEEDAMNQFLSAKLGSFEDGIEEKVAAFAEGEYTQSKQLFDGILQHAKDISKRATVGVIADGWGLSNTQLIVKEDVKYSVTKNKKAVHLVKGEPGSGKTLVAVYALLEFLDSETRVVLSFRNSRLMTILRRCFDKSIPGASGLLKYLGDARDPRKGLVNSNEFFDLIVVDEGQRIKETDIPRLLQRSNIFLVLYDEYQMLVPYEGGNKASYLKHAREAGYEIKEYELTAAARCRGGKPYQEWIDSLLSSGTDLSSGDKRDWKEQYDFRVFQNLGDMIESLRGVHRLTNYDVCLLASFTETDGKTSRIRTNKPELLWAMDEAHYTKFWLNRGSNNLDQCASVYGCQGFERYYAGIIWGRDYCRRGNKWQIPSNHTITDAIGSRGHRLIDLAKNKDPRALELLFNRYRIMLTRGILGTFIYAEDDETRDYLAELTSLK